ncbi:MAG: DUF6502 family protein [Nitrospirota bacterium]
MKPRPSALLAAISHLLRPLVRLLLRHGIPFKAVAEVAKHVYVTVAMDEFALPTRKQTVSRVSVLTGLSRKEVHRVLAIPPQQDQDAAIRYNRAARIVTGWIRDAEFLDKQGRPRPLPWQGRRRSFAALVERYSGDIPARAVLDELLRVGVVRRLEDGRVQLLTRGYVPQTSEPDKLAILGTDVADLVTTIDHNLQHGSSTPRFQRKVMYDNLPAEAVARFRTLASRSAQKLLEGFDRWLARHDRDRSPSVRGTGRLRAGVGIYYFEEDLTSAPPGGDHP